MDKYLREPSGVLFVTDRFGNLNPVGVTNMEPDYY